MPVLSKLGITRSDRRAIEGHILLTGCSYFTAAIVCAALAPVLKNAAKINAIKHRENLQRAAAWVSEQTAGIQQDGPSEHSQLKEITPYTSTSPTSADEAKAKERVQAAVKQNPELGSVVNYFKNTADSILAARLDPNNEFAAVVGESLYKLQMKLSKFLVLHGLRISSDILTAYVVCALLDKARTNTPLGNYAPFKTTVIGADPSNAVAAGSNYFLSSSFRFFLFASFSRGSAISGFIKHYASRYVNTDAVIFGGSGGKKTFTPKSTLNAPRAWLAELISYYDIRNAPFLHIASIPYYLIALSTFHAQCHVANLGAFPSSLHPIVPSTYVATLSKLGPAELCYWIILDQTVRASTSVVRLVLKGKAQQIGRKLVESTQPAPKAGKPASAPLTVGGAVAKRLNNLFVKCLGVYVVTYVGVRVVNSDPAQAGFFVSLLRGFHNKVLCSLVNADKGPAYIWSVTVFQGLMGWN